MFEETVRHSGYSCIHKQNIQFTVSGAQRPPVYVNSAFSSIVRKLVCVLISPSSTWHKYLLIFQLKIKCDMLTID